MHSALEHGGEMWVQNQRHCVVLCFLARNATLTVPLSSQEYKWVLKNCQGNWMKQQGYGVMDQLSLQGE